MAAIEFLPVIALAALGARMARNGGALVLAVGGVYLLTDVQIAAEPVGLAFAFANAALFALYIVLAHRVAQDGRMSGIDALSLALWSVGMLALVYATVAFVGGWGLAHQAVAILGVLCLVWAVSVPGIFYAADRHRQAATSVRRVQIDDIA